MHARAVEQVRHQVAPVGRGRGPQRGELPLDRRGVAPSAHSLDAADLLALERGVDAQDRRRAVISLEVRVDAIGLDSTFGTLSAEASLAAPAPAEIRLRFAAQHQNREPVELLLDEVEALYCAGPAGGAGVRRRLVPRLASASCRMTRRFCSCSE